MGPQRKSADEKDWQEKTNLPTFGVLFLFPVLLATAMVKQNSMFCEDNEREEKNFRKEMLAKC
jgi:hypothetical protein